jgi:uncharacterized membrane protein
MVFKLEKYHELFFSIIIFLNYFVYIVTFLGLYNFDPKYLDDFHFYFQLYICSFLIIHFFPFRKVRFGNLDRRIAFSSGIIIFTTVILNQLPIAKNVLQKIKDVKNKVVDRDHSHYETEPVVKTIPYNTMANTIPYPTQSLGY